MPSMSYCMFENTSLEMQQIVDTMEEAVTWGDLDLNEYENHARGRLYDLCESYLNLCGKLEDSSQFES